MILNKHLHIVSFDVPYPPNYGGVIDVFYKLKNLHKLGVIIYLHCFEYGRGESKELEKFCQKIFYYKRDATIKNLLSKTPFRIKIRSNIDLVKNLNEIKCPILFEGLHTTYSLLTEEFDDRKKIVRAHNIEHLYHEGLCKSERRIDKKIFFKSEAIKLISYEKILHKVDSILTISPAENDYFKEKFGEKATYIPAFHQNSTVQELSKKGNYALYHGDLRVSDNKRSVLFLISIFKKINYTLIIAGSIKYPRIINKIREHKNIKFVEIKQQETLEDLLKYAHINVLPTFQKTGIKLKLINTLFNSRFCVVNNEMIEDTGLEDLCILCKTKEEFSRKITELTQIEYTNQERIKRIKFLKPFNNKENAQKIVDLIY